MKITLSTQRARSAFIIIIILIFLAVAAVAGIAWAVYKVKKVIHRIDNNINNRNTNDAEIAFQNVNISQISDLIPPGWAIDNIQILPDDAPIMAAPIPVNPQWETSTNLVDWEPSGEPSLNFNESMRFYRVRNNTDIER